MNPAQADVDLDGFGNPCDADCNGDAIVSSHDVAQANMQFGNDCNANPALSCTCDFNGDGVVGSPDLAQLNMSFGQPIGPSALTACANATDTDDPCVPPLAILDPLIQTNVSAGPIPVRLRHNALADTDTLTARLNGQPLAIPAGAVGAIETSFEIPDGDLRDGRNVLSVFVESADSTALLGGGGGFYLVRHRVFYRNDQDRDGLKDASEPAGGTNNADTDGDGLLDRVESDLTKTSPSGAITITGVEPNPIIPGHAVAILGSGMENIDQGSEVLFNGSPSPMILHTSPSAVVAKVPANLSGSSATITLLGASGGGAAPVPVAMESMPPMDVVPNLVMAAGANIQFLKPEFPTAQVNRPFLLNMLHFGSDTRVLIDYSASDPTRVAASFHPYLEELLRIEGGVTDITTNFILPLSSDLLQDVDLVYIVVVDTSNVASPGCQVPVPQLYTPGELAAITDWMAVPGHRLLVASDPWCFNDNHLVTNPILQAIGASSRFDLSFFAGHQQENVSYHTLYPLNDPPLTNGVFALFYSTSGDIILGPGATLTAESRICLAGETGNTIPGPFGDDLLVDCQFGEQVFPPLVTSYVASETLPVASPDPVVEITTVNAPLVNPVAVPGGPGTLVELDPLTDLLSPPSTIQIDGTFQNISPTRVTVNGTAATIVGNTFSAQLSGFLTAQHEARGIFVEAVNDQGPQAIRPRTRS